ncbi:MAG: outer rane biosis protein BamB [Planctomycetaceae bacterium]|nr:outer rane biosis protein BamB [Planctomycetaceae bacterium]
MQKRVWGFFSLVVLLCAAPLLAGTFFGTIESVDADARSVVVAGAKNAGSKTFEIPEKASISVAGKKSDFDALVEGASVTVSTDASNKVTKINVRAAAGATARDKGASAKKSATPKGDGDSENTAGAGKVTPGDWPCYGGLDHDNVSRETGLLKAWPSGGPKLAWQANGSGEGYASVSVADGMIFTMGNIGSNEAVTAFSLETGKVLWQQKTGAASRLQAGNGPRGTPTYDDGQVYALGGNGDLTSLNAKTGKQSWRKNILQDFGGNNIQWGISESVLIDGDRLICTPGGSNGTIVALDKSTGKPQWRSSVPGKPRAGYSSAIVAEVDGVRQYVQFLHTGVVGVKADTGEFLWGNDASANGTANCSSPVFADNMVFSASGYGKGGAMVKLAAKGRKIFATPGYHTNKMESHHGGMVLLNGCVYGSSDPGVVRCLDLATGDVKWEDRSVGKGSITCADGYLYVRSENGPVALVEASPSGYNETGRFEQPDRSNANAWAHPVVSHGKLILRDQDLVLVYDVKE